MDCKCWAEKSQPDTRARLPQDLLHTAEASGCIFKLMQVASEWHQTHDAPQQKTGSQRGSRKPPSSSKARKKKQPTMRELTSFLVALEMARNIEMPMLNGHRTRVSSLKAVCDHRELRHGKAGKAGARAAAGHGRACMASQDRLSLPDSLSRDQAAR